MIRLFPLLSVLALGGCASASSYHNPKDPLESFNRSMYSFNDTLDRAVLKPVAQGYNAVVPPPGRMMLSNFFSNLDDVIVTANDLLQLKVIQAFSDAGRVVVNTTVGLFGLADVASHVGMDKHHEDFGQTLGRWGIGSGPYLVLPLLGPSSVRDGIGLYADSRIDPLQNVSNVPARNEGLATDAVNRRAELLGQENLLDTAAIDRYSFIRDAYLQHRKNLVYDGNPPREKLYDDEEDDGTPVSPPAKANGVRNESSITPSVTEAAPGASPMADVIPENARVAEPLTSVYHIWLGQREGIR